MPPSISVATNAANFILFVSFDVNNSSPLESNDSPTMLFHSIENVQCSRLLNAKMLLARGRNRPHGPAIGIGAIRGKRKSPSAGGPAPGLTMNWKPKTGAGFLL
jgi:hypothetical protein